MIYTHNHYQMFSGLTYYQPHPPPPPKKKKKGETVTLYMEKLGK